VNQIATSEIVLASRPIGRPKVTDFTLRRRALPALKEREVLVRVIYLSIDPYMRGLLSESGSHLAPLAIGDMIPGESVAEIIDSRNSDFTVGTLVRCHTGWTTHAILPGEMLKRLEVGLPTPSTALGVLGMPGFTAYAGLMLIGKPKPGETVVVAAASGPVGSMVGQLARLAGAKVVGVAGGPEKCAYLRSELGFDAAVDHRSPDFTDQLRQSCPQGIDVYFENVGGAVWQAVLPLLNTLSRVPVCGLVGEYDDVDSHGAGTNLLPATMRAVLNKSITIRGFVNREFEAEHRAAFIDSISHKVASGFVLYREDFTDGLESAPVALIKLLSGQNFGKTIVRVAVPGDE
jgi:NADPH-dependent curcumin reductase CurA